MYYFVAEQKAEAASKVEPRTTFNVILTIPFFTYLLTCFSILKTSCKFRFYFSSGQKLCILFIIENPRYKFPHVQSKQAEEEDGNQERVSYC